MYLVQVFNDSPRIRDWRMVATIWESTVGYCFVVAGPGGGLPPSVFSLAEDAIKVAKGLATDCAVRSGVIESHSGIRLFDSQDWPHEVKPDPLVQMSPVRREREAEVPGGCGVRRPLPAVPGLTRSTVPGRVHT